MKKSRQIQTKAVLCVIGIIILGVIAGTCLIVKNGRIPKGEFVVKTEAANVLEALLQIDSSRSSLEGIIEKLRAPDPDTEEPKQEEYYLTYAEALEIQTAFGGETLPFLNEYKNDHCILLTDWELLSDQLIGRYGKGEILKEELQLLGAGDQVTSQQGEHLASDEILTMEGVYKDRTGKAAVQMKDGVSQTGTKLQAITYQDTILNILESRKEDQVIYNAYIIEAAENLTFFWNHYRVEVKNSLPEGKGQEKEVADLTLNASGVTDCVLKEEYINGRILKLEEDTVEVEGYGSIQKDPHMEIYQLYGQMSSKSISDLRIGYAFTDFVIENGKIVACLIMKEEAMDSIRVLIRNTDYAGRYHENVVFTCDYPYKIVYYEKGKESHTEEKKAGEIFELGDEQTLSEEERLVVRPDVLSGRIQLQSVIRSQGMPTYSGSMEIEKQKDGYVLVNEVLLEEYLYHVVPSEMPSSYPLDALKAQAVCARTYAYGKMLHAGLAQFGAHVDDSAGFQVYNNIKEQAATTEAVKATLGEILWYQDAPVGAYYYSTSCGVGTDTRIWKGYQEELPPYIVAKKIGENQEDDLAENLKQEDIFQKFIEEKQVDSYEKEEGWYRWTYTVDTIDPEKIDSILKARYESNEKLILTQNQSGEFESKKISSLGKIQDIEIVKRNPGGVADELVIYGTKAVVKVISELNIRYVLDNGESKVVRQTLDEVAAPQTLPSAFFAIETGKEKGYVVGYKIVGGGFGHGVGMSQNGAKAMAALGTDYQEILSFFYENSEIKTILQKGD